MTGNKEEIKLIVGLGNPGLEYDGTRHNVGFMVLDRLLTNPPFERFEEKHIANSIVFTGNFRGRALMLQKPQTFMNSSGEAVALIARKQGLSPESILVVYDDMDLPLGRLRFREGGSDGGHNGIKSIIAELGSATFKRFRLGIGRPTTPKTIDYVLSKFEERDIETLKTVLITSVDAVCTVLTGGMSLAMNKFNAWSMPEKSETNQK